MKKFIYSIFLILTALIASNVVHAASTDYDGKWNGLISCTAYSGNATLGAFTRNNVYAIENGKVTSKYTTAGGKNVLTTTGVVSGVNTNLTISGTSETAQWFFNFKGKPSSAENISYIGEMVEQGVKKRDCTMEFSALDPAIGSLAFKKINSNQIASSSQPIKTPTSEAAKSPVTPTVPPLTKNAAPVQPVQPATNPAPKVAEKATNPQSASVGIASFDCNKATSMQEKLICTTPALSSLDLKLAEAYKSAQATTADAPKLKNEQIAWIKETRACGGDATCLERFYNTRINELTPQPAPIATPSTAPNDAAQTSAPVASESALAASEQAATAPSTPITTSPQVSTVEEKTVPIWEDKYFKLGGGVVLSIALLGFAYWLIKKLVLGVKKGAAAAAKKGAEIRHDVVEKSALAKEKMVEKATQAREAMAEKAVEYSSDMATKTKEVSEATSSKFQHGLGEVAAKSAPYFQTIKSDFNILISEDLDFQVLDDNSTNTSLEEFHTTLKKIAYELKIYSHSKLRDLINPLDVNVAKEFSSEISTGIDKNLFDKTEYVYSNFLKIEKLIVDFNKNDELILLIIDRLPDALKKYQERISPLIITSEEKLTDETIPFKTKSGIIANSSKDLICEILSMESSSKNWELIRASLFIAGLEDGFNNITLNNKYLKDDIYQKISLIYQPIQFYENLHEGSLNKFPNELLDFILQQKYLMEIRFIARPHIDSLRNRFNSKGQLIILKWVTILWYSIFIFCALLFIKDYIFGSSIPKSKDDNIIFNLLFCGAIGYGLPMLFKQDTLKRINKHRCNKCLQTYCIIEAKKDFLGSSQALVDEETTSKVSGTDGRHIADIKGTRQVIRKNNHYRYHYCCLGCGDVFSLES